MGRENGVMLAWGSLTLVGSLGAYLIAASSFPVAAGVWALLAGLWSAAVFGLAGRFSRPQQAGIAPAANAEQAVLQGLKDIDACVLENLDMVSTVSANAVETVVERINNVRGNSSDLINYLEESEHQSVKLQTVIDKNKDTIEYIYKFVQHLQSKIDDERQQSARIVSEVKKLSEMTHVIRAIARQTEILAINARIEAARAGAAGLGFAELAGEVRRLSVQSDESATRIESDINRLIQTVGESLGKDFEAHIQLEREDSQNLLGLTQQLSDGYMDMHDFYKIMLASVTEHNIKLDQNIQSLLDLGQHQDVIKQIIDRVHPVLEQRHAYLQQWLHEMKQQDCDSDLVPEKLQSMLRDYKASELDHGGTGELVDNRTGKTLQRIELF